MIIENRQISLGKRDELITKADFKYTLESKWLKRPSHDKQMLAKLVGEHENVGQLVRSHVKHTS